MAVSVLFHDISDLCLGKPAIRSLPSSATVGDALSALKKTGEQYLSVWSCDHAKKTEGGSGDCRCVGKVCMVDVVVYLCREENLSDLAAALQAPLSILLPEVPGLVRHVEPNCSLLEALDLILDGAQNLVVPIQTRRKKPHKSHLSHANGREFCWITQEDIVRFLLNGIGLFSPIPALSVDSLGIIRSDILAVGYHDAAVSALDSIALAHAEQTSVAVVAPDGALIGEISPATVAACGEAVAPAILALPAGDLMSYIDCGGPPTHLIRAVKAWLRDQNLDAMMELLGELSNCSSSSSDDDSPVPDGARSPTGPLRTSLSMRSRMVRRSEAIVCQKGSSLVAVMIQALAHRVNYMWVIDDDCSLAGIVTFSDVLRVFREHFQAYE
ncbi:CBS domain-containing protein CBSX5-like [Aristolochia californica]|uniref:CBS domain-containing protein CBSX5-like n=1 Tax=Aristolochia californica TaxID=171875 RepID=UPI0035D7EF04